MKMSTWCMVLGLLWIFGYIISFFITDKSNSIFILISQLWLIAAHFFHYFEEKDMRND